MPSQGRLESLTKFWAEWLGVFLFCAALCAYFQFQTPFLPEEDGYFHIKVAWLMRQQGLFLKGFPWSYFSLWRENYSDGCPLFHLLLIPFTFGDLAFGAKSATVLLSAFMFSSFFAILTLNKVRGRFYWLWVLLLGGWFFWWRMLVPRPQVLSATLLLWSLHFLINGRPKAFAALSFLYPLSYVAAFLPQVFAVARWAYLRIVEGRSEHRIVFWGLGAFALAVIVHPYFPKNIMFFYVQNLWVMYAHVARIDLSFAGELIPLNTRQAVSAHLPLLVNLLGLGLVFAHRRRPLSERTRVMLPITLVTLLLGCVSIRFVEYAVPVATLFGAFLFTDVFADYGVREFLRDYGKAGRAFAAAWLLGMASASLIEAVTVRGYFAAVKTPRFQGLARTLAEKAPAGELIYTCDWDEPPQLLFYNSQHRYPVMMDPSFMYYWDPAIWKKWTDLAHARLSADETRRTLKETFQARFGVCGKKFTALRALLGGGPFFNILAEDENGFVFEAL